MVAVFAVDAAAQSPTSGGSVLGTLDAAVTWLGNHGFDVGVASTTDGQTTLTATRAGSSPADEGTVCRLVVAASGLASASLAIDLSDRSAGDLAVAWTGDFATTGLGFMAWALSAGATGSEARVVDLGDRSLSVSVASTGGVARATLLVQVSDRPASSESPSPGPAAAIS